MEEKKIKSFTDLKAWIEARRLVLQIYKLITKFPKEEVYSLSDQIKRASISIAANLAEGYGMRTYKDKIRYYYMSQGSINELKSHLIISRDLEYISKEELNNLASQIKYLHSLIHGLISSTNKIKKDL
jgi:four helix bundle protein